MKCYTHTTVKFYKETKVSSTKDRISYAVFPESAVVRASRTTWPSDTFM